MLLPMTHRDWIDLIRLAAIACTGLLLWGLWDDWRVGPQPTVPRRWLIAVVLCSLSCAVLKPELFLILVTLPFEFIKDFILDPLAEWARHHRTLVLCGIVGWIIVRFMNSVDERVQALQKRLEQLDDRLDDLDDRL